MQLDPQFETLHNCTNFTNQQLKHINLARSLTGVLCMVVATLILVALIFYKAYKSVLQRLFLYITAATVIGEGAFSLAIEHQFFFTILKTQCVHFMVSF